MADIKYTEKHIILPGQCDFSGKLGVFDTFRLFMDMAFVHANLLGVGQVLFISKGLFWLTVKTRIKFFRRPAMGESVEVSTWPMTPQAMKCHRCYRITQGDNILCEGITEWVVFDTKHNAVVRQNTLYPQGTEFSDEQVSFTDFPKVDITIENSEAAGTVQVSSMDIDLGKHMNNAAYVRAVLNNYSINDMTKNDIQDISVIFKNSAHENDVLNMREKQEGSVKDVCLFFKDGTPSFFCRIKFRDSL